MTQHLLYLDATIYGSKQPGKNEIELDDKNLFEIWFTFVDGVVNITRVYITNCSLMPVYTHWYFDGLVNKYIEINEAYRSELYESNE
jgi:hypothetical protein